MDADWFNYSRGRFVLTASGSREYSYEGEPAEGQVQPASVFTSAPIEGILTGGADFDPDGHITPTTPSPTDAATLQGSEAGRDSAS